MTWLFKFANYANFLNYRPSQIAACVCIISINLYEKDLAIQDGKKTHFPNIVKG